MHTQIQRRSIPTDSDLPTDLHPVVHRVLAARQVTAAEPLDYSLRHLHAFQQLTDIEPAVTLLQQALQAQQHLLIVADYDADGATSCAVAVKALRQMGAQRVSFIVPNREKHGYGLTPAIVELARPHQPDLLITVDNGIASVNGVAAAKQAGMQVLITDHHLPPATLPAADAIVNPNQAGDSFPSKNLAGVGVIFYLLSALRSRLRAAGWFEQQGIPMPNMAELLDLVALGTVADVVKLDYNNRVLVEQGLKRIRANQCCHGIRALLKVSKRNQSLLVASDLGFALGPRLNAAGRMDDMSYGIECLLSDNEQQALERATLLDTFNQERRFVEAEMLQTALNTLETLQLADTDDLPLGLCLFDKDWHQGVIGILASRIKDRLHRPIIIFTLADGGDNIRGSARSVTGVHIRDVLDAIATQHPQLLNKFGGHAMAAGLTLPLKHLQTFQSAFDAEVRKHLSADNLHGILHSDGELNTADFTLDLAEQLRMLSPWGQGFPEPVFDGRFQLLEKHLLKQQHLKMQVSPLGSQVVLDAIAFNTVDTDWAADTREVHLAYKLDVNVFRGVRSVQLLVEAVTAL